MLSKNNRKYQYYKQEDKKQHFGLRKLSIGVASVLLGTTFALMGGSSVYADTPTDIGNQVVAVQQSADQQSPVSQSAQPARESSAASQANTAFTSASAGQPVETSVDSSAAEVDNSSTATKMETANEESTASPAEKENSNQPTAVKLTKDEKTQPVQKKEAKAPAPVVLAYQDGPASSGDANEVRAQEISDDPVVNFMTEDYKRTIFNDRSNFVGVVTQEEKTKNYANDDRYVGVSPDGIINFHGKSIDISKNCHIYIRTIIFHYWDGSKVTKKQQESIFLKNFSYDFKTNKVEDLSPGFIGKNIWPAYKLPENSYLKHDSDYLTNEPVKEVHEDAFDSYDSPKNINQTVDVYVGQPEKITFNYINAYTGEKLTPLWYGVPADTTAEFDPSWKGQKLADYIGKGDVEDNQPSVAERPAYPINGYKLINYDGVASQIIDGSGDKTYTFEYAPLSPIVIKYVDEDNNQTIYTTTIDNVANGALPSQHYTTKQLEIPGYRFDHSSDKVDGIVGQYQKSDDDPNPITVTYYYKEIDKNVARYSREAVRSDKRHDPFSLDPLGKHDIDTPIDYTTANQEYQDFLKSNGYTDVGGENTVAGIYTGQENHINYYYVKDQPVVINFLKAVMKNGQVIDTTTSVQDSQTIEAGKGDWAANASSIAGYQFNHVEFGAQSADGTVASGTNKDSTVNGQFAVVPQQVNFYYLPQVAYNVHYRDVTAKVAGGQTTGFTPNEGSSLDYGHEVIGISGSVGDAPDKTNKLWDYRAAGYALAEGPADLGKATLFENMGDVNDRTGDQYVYLVRTPTEHTEQRSASRTIHYVGVDNDYADATKSTTIVAPSKTQEVNLTGTYYTDANMLLVNTKEVTLNGQKVTIIDPTNTNQASETWEIDSAKGVKKDGDDYVFAQIKVPAAFGKWKHYANLDQNNSRCPVDPNSPLWQETLSDVYLAYRQKGQYVVHYRDVTGVDKTTFTPSDGTALHDTEAISGWLNDEPDGRDQLWTKYGDDGYVVVQSDDFLAQRRITANNTPDQYVYLMKVATPQTEDKVIKRTIHYVAKTANGQALKADQVQQVTLTGTYYVDSKGNRVHASELKDAQGNVQKDTDGHIIYVVSNGTPQETWTIKDDPANHDVTVNAENAQKFDFAKAEGGEAPATITAKDGGTWHYFGQKDNATCAFDPAKNNEQQVTLSPVYLIYKQMGSYNIHYVDVTGSDKTSGYTPSDGVEKTTWLISNIGNGKYAGDPTDASPDLSNRAGLFQNDYVIVESSPNLGQQTVEPNMKDQYVYLIHKAIKHTDTKAATRTVHYVANSKEGKQLQDDTVQNVTLDGIYYTDAVSGKMVHAKDFNGTLIIDNSQDKPATELWTVDPATKGDLTADGKSFKKVTGSKTITLNKQQAQSRQVNSGDWYLTNSNSIGSVSFGDPSDTNWTTDKPNELPTGYLIYKQKAQYGIHYIDVNAVKGKNNYEPTDGRELTAHQIANIGEQGYVGDTPDASSQLWNYGQAGYVLVSVSDNAQNDQLGKQTLTNEVQDQYVYLIHKAIEHNDTKTAVRTIHYVANSRDGKQLQDNTVQKVTLDGVYYTDAVTGELVHVKKDQAGNLVVDNSQSGSASEVWTVDPATTSDLTADGKAFKKVAGSKTITLDQQQAQSRQVNSGDWHLTNPDSISSVSFGDPASNSWTTAKPNELPAGYLIYKQKGSYNIHYVDVTGSDKASGFTPEDGTEKTSWLISDIGADKYADDPTDASADLANRAKDFQDDYVIVDESPNLGKLKVEPNMQDQYVYLARKAIEQTEAKTAIRLIHYVADSKTGKQLQEDTTQKVILNGVYYTDAVTGERVHAKNFKNTLIVDNSQTGPVEDEWTVDPATKGDLTADGGSFEEVAGPATITLSKQAAKDRQVNSGDWYLTDTDSNGQVPFGDPVNTSWTVKKPNELPAGYLIYKQKAQYGIHYIDVNAVGKGSYEPTDGQDLTDHQISNIGEHNYVGDIPDVTDQLWDYGKAGYVLVGVSDNAQNDQLGKQALASGIQDQYVYLAHKVIKHNEAKTATRTIRYVGVAHADDDVTKSASVAPSTTQQVALTGTYYTDATVVNGQAPVNVKTVTVNGQQVTVVDPTNSTPAVETWKVDSADGVTKDDNGYTFAKADVPAAFGKWEHFGSLDKDNDKVTVNPNDPDWQDQLTDVYLAYRQRGQYVVHYRDVTGVDKTAFTPSDGTALRDTNAISGWLNDSPDGTDQLWTHYGDDGYAIVQSDSNLAKQAITANTPDQYVYLMKVATPQTEDKVAQRVIHYVAKTVDGQSLKADQVQQATLTGTYYVDSKGNRVHASERQDAQGQTVYVVSNGAPQETWAIKNDPANHDVTVNAGDDQKFDFAQAKGSEAPAIITADDGGTWYYVAQQDNRSYPFDPAKSNEQQVTLTPIYLIYKQKAQYNIRYVDVNEANTELTTHQVSNIGAQEYVGDTPDVSGQLWNYGKTGYVLVGVSDNAQNGRLGKQTLINDIQDQYVYLAHKAIEHNDTKTAIRTIHYVANSQSGKQLQNDTVQKVTLKGIYYTDAVTDNMVHAKNFNGTLIVDSSQDEPATEVWTVDPTTKADVAADGKSFKGIADPTTIILNSQEAKSRQVNIGKWILTGADSNGQVSFGDPSSTGWATELPAGYLIYTHVHTYRLGKPEIRTFMRTIRYVDAVTDELIPAELGPSHENVVTQKTTISRTPVYDENNVFVGYGTVDEDGNFIADDNAVLPEQDSPDLHAAGYTSAASKDVADPMAVGEMKLTADSPSNTTVTIKYGHQHVTVTPNNPADKDKNPNTLINPNDPRSKDHQAKYGSQADHQALMRTVSRTITYVYRDDPTVLVDGAPNGESSFTQMATFCLAAVFDRVTGQFLGYDTTGDDQPDFTDINQAWANVPAQSLKVVPSKDPSAVDFEHYDLAKVGAITLKATDKPVKVTVKYWKPVHQGAFTVVYIDDNTGKELSRYKAKLAKFGTPITYTTTDTISELEKQGYQLAKDGYKNKVGTTYSTKNNGQTYVVVLKHATAKKATNKPVKETVHYVYQDGRQAYADHVATSTFTHTVETDNVTGKVISDTWTGGQPFGEVESPRIEGYTPDLAAIAQQAVDHNSKDLVFIVTYTSNPTPQTYNTTVKYVDEDGHELIPAVPGQAGLKPGEKFDNTGAVKEAITTSDGTKYELIKSTMTTGKIVDRDVTTTCTYRKVTSPAPTTYTVTVNYVDEHGKPLKKPVVVGTDLTTGTAYTTVADKLTTIDADGQTYVLDGIKPGDSETGVINGQNVGVTYVYKLKETLQPSEQPVQPSEHPAQPSEQPVQPSDHPTQPSNQPAQPSEQPVQPSDHPTQPSEQPAQPSEQPSQSSEQPTQPSEQPAQPSDHPTQPSDQPAQLSRQPTQPTRRPVQLGGQPTRLNNQVQLTTQSSMRPTQSIADNLGEPSISPKPAAVTQQEKLPQTGNDKLSIIEAGVLGMANALAGFILGKKRRHE